MCFGKNVPVQDQGPPHYDTGQKQCHIKRQDSPRKVELFTQSFVLVGAMKCPLKEQTNEGNMVIEQRQMKTFQQPNVQQQYCLARRQSDLNLFISKPCCVTAETRMKEQITFGNTFIPQQQTRARNNRSHEHVNSWGKSSFHGGEYGVGASHNQAKIQTMMMPKENQNCSLSQEINWQIFNSIIIVN